jgi:hypothetical protein
MGIRSSLKCYVGKGHTAPVLEDLMRLRSHLERDDQSLISDVVRIVKGMVNEQEKIKKNN